MHVNYTVACLFFRTTTVFSGSDLNSWKTTIGQILSVPNFFITWVYKNTVEGIESI